MIIKDYTLNKNFSDLQEGTCFIKNSEYYMKIYIKYYNEYTNKMDTSYKNYAVNLKTGIAEVVKEDEKVRIVKGTIMIE